MTKEQIITHLASVASAVFLADNKVRPQWQERLRATRDADPDTKEQTAMQYLRAVAEEMLRSYSDEELQRLYPDNPNNE
jgi:hypothetical protein